MRRLLLGLVLIPMTVPVYAERNCTDHFAEDAYSTWTNCTGTRTDANGAVYEGDWNNGKYHGKGKFSWSSGTVYEVDLNIFGGSTMSPLLVESRRTIIEHWAAWAIDSLYKTQGLSPSVLISTGKRFGKG